MSFWAAFSCVIIAFRTNIGSASTNALTFICHLRWTLPVTRACFLQITAWKPQLCVYPQNSINQRRIFLFSFPCHMEFIHSLFQHRWSGDKENRSLQTDSGFPLKSTDQCAVNGAVPDEEEPLWLFRVWWVRIVEEEIVQDPLNEGKKVTMITVGEDTVKVKEIMAGRPQKYLSAFWNPLTITGINICWQLLQGKEW